MRCPVCGREMIDKGTHLECPNILCDYEEDVYCEEVLLVQKNGVPRIVSNNSVSTPC
jgi:hypothetical protein